jgi:hypothetical protein
MAAQMLLQIDVRILATSNTTWWMVPPVKSKRGLYRLDTAPPLSYPTDAQALPVEREAHLCADRGSDHHLVVDVERGVPSVSCRSPIFSLMNSTPTMCRPAGDAPDSWYSGEERHQFLDLVGCFAARSRASST